MLNSSKTMCCSFGNSDNGQKCEFVSDAIHHGKTVFVSFSGESVQVSKVRVRHSYQDIVEACCKGLWPHWPGLGGWMVNVSQVTHTHTHTYKPTQTFFILQISQHMSINCKSWNFSLKQVKQCQSGSNLKYRGSLSLLRVFVYDSEIILIQAELHWKAVTLHNSFKSLKRIGFWDFILEIYSRCMK